MTLRDEFVSIMNAEGASSEGGWHSWRCFDKERYPEPCLCTETVAGMLVRAALRDAVEAVSATHRKLAVIECSCGYGSTCLECPPGSNRVVGFCCSICCDVIVNDDEGYCSDFHGPDDSGVHHVDSQYWNGPWCPTIAAIETLEGEQ